MALSVHCNEVPGLLFPTYIINYMISQLELFELLVCVSALCTPFVHLD